MKSVLKSIACVLLGFVVASVVMMIVESINGHLLYPALGKAAEGVKDPAVLRRLMATAPRGALLVVLFGWSLGGFTGGFVTGKLAPKAPIVHGLALALLLTLACVANNLMIPPPTWFWVAGLVICGPMAFIGARLAGQRS